MQGGGKCLTEKITHITKSGKSHYSSGFDEMEKHEDIAVRGGVKLTREYIQHLKDENKRLEEQNKLKNEYLKKVVGR